MPLPRHRQPRELGRDGAGGVNMTWTLAWICKKLEAIQASSSPPCRDEEGGVLSQCARHVLEFSAISAGRRRDDSKISYARTASLLPDTFLHPLVLHWVLAIMAGGAVPSSVSCWNSSSLVTEFHPTQYSSGVLVFIAFEGIDNGTVDTQRAITNTTSLTSLLVTARLHPYIKGPLPPLKTITQIEQSRGEQSSSLSLAPPLSITLSEPGDVGMDVDGHDDSDSSSSPTSCVSSAGSSPGGSPLVIGACNRCLMYCMVARKDFPVCIKCKQPCLKDLLPDKKDADDAAAEADADKKHGKRK
ncbi:hypothetical protein GUJ93_ZPchr0012g22146 [Zizania palustris]|uniref:Uncharacterized protein n=1 Tax=Zizania palustris TaxID=103762 RepID=A0A8J5WSN8_ZIZPA|nr:hypothetical protein GUJ93_ZPchr0012g22146 [Zizania palustris]